MKARTLRALARDNDRVLRTLAERWGKGAQCDPVLNAIWLRNHIVFEFAVILGSLTIGILVCLVGYDVISAFHAFMGTPKALANCSTVAVFTGFSAWLIELAFRQFNDTPWVYWDRHQRNDASRMNRRFLEAITVIESKIGPLSQYNQLWVKGENVIVAAERVILEMAGEVMRLQEIPWKRRDSEILKRRMIDLLASLSRATGISTDVSLYFVPSRIEQQARMEREEIDIREGRNGGLASI